jgi:hypothetical protein
MMSQAHRSGGKPTGATAGLPIPRLRQAKNGGDYFHHSSGLAKRAYLSSEALARREENVTFSFLWCFYH